MRNASYLLQITVSRRRRDIDRRTRYDYAQESTPDTIDKLGEKKRLRISTAPTARSISCQFDLARRQQYRKNVGAARGSSALEEGDRTAVRRPQIAVRVAERGMRKGREGEGFGEREAAGIKGGE